MESMSELFNSSYGLLIHPYLIGGASAGLIFYLVASMIQAAAIYKVCGKMNMGKIKKIILTAVVILPFGTGVSLAFIAYGEHRIRHPE